MRTNKFITYGFFINPEKFLPATTGRRWYMNKPDGGLWGSPEDSEYGWKDWCLGEDFRTEKLQIWTKFVILPGTKILEIDSLEDLKEAIRKFGKYDQRLEINYLDWEHIKNSWYRGVFLSERGNRQCHLPLEYGAPDLNGWDCESIVLFDLDCISITGYGRSTNETSISS